MQGRNSWCFLEREGVGEGERERVGGKFLMECLVLNDVNPEAKGKEEELSIVHYYNTSEDNHIFHIASIDHFIT
jgi:hypothetical protein